MGQSLALRPHFDSELTISARRYRFPLELVCSVFDLVFAEGVEAIFRFSVAILKRNEKIICELEFDHLLEYLKNRLFEAYAVSVLSSIVVDVADTADSYVQPDSTEDGYDALYKADEFVREALQIKITPLMLVRHLTAPSTSIP